MFLSIIKPSVFLTSSIKDWFRCSCQRFLSRTSQESLRTTAAGNTQHCSENVGQHTQPELNSDMHGTTIKLPQEPHQWLFYKLDLRYGYLFPNWEFTRPTRWLERKFWNECLQCQKEIQIDSKLNVTWFLSAGELTGSVSQSMLFV